MDNKITKKRLSNFLAYEWILIIVVVVSAIFVWELVYSVASVRLTTGQEFKYYYDTTVLSSNDSAFYGLFDFKGENSTFSFDVMTFTKEALSDDYNTLSVRTSVQEGDIIISDTSVAEDAEEGTKSSADTLIYNYQLYAMDKLLADAEAYLKTFLLDGKTGELDHLNFENYDRAKMEKSFFDRLSKDNRYRAGQISPENEVQRIQKLCKEVKDFKFLYENHPEIFYETKVPVYEGETDTGAVAKYGIKPEMLSGGEHNPSEFFRIKGSQTGDAKNTVILVFDFLNYQKELQFETISFLNTVVRNCSNLLA